MTCNLWVDINHVQVTKNGQLLIGFLVMMIKQQLKITSILVGPSILAGPAPVGGYTVPAVAAAAAAGPIA